MAFFSLNTAAFASSASANAFLTAAMIIGAAGKRARLVHLHVSCAGETAHDEPMRVRVGKTNQAGAGTAGASPTPKPTDSAAGVASVLTCGTAYSAEPTTYDTITTTGCFWEAGFNGRGFLTQNWMPEYAPVINGAQSLGILIAPSTANARKTNVSIIWEEF
jgi:hypothetical protein